MNGPSGTARFDEWIAIEEAAAYLAIPVRTLYRLAQRGQVPATKVGRTWRFKRTILDEHLGGVTQAHAAADLSAKSGSAVPPEAGLERASQVKVGNARLLAASRRWGEYLEGIERLSRELSRTRDVRAVGEAVARQIGDIIDFDGLRFYVLQPDGMTLEAVALESRVEYYATETAELVRLRLGEGLGGTIAVARQAEVIPDVLADPRMQDIAGTDAVDESMIVVPLVFEDRVLGVLELSRLGCDAFDATELRLMQILGAQAAVALVNAAQVEELERRSERLGRQLESQRQLLVITERLLKTREPAAIFEAIAETLETVVPFDTLTIYLVDREASVLVPVLARDQYAEQILEARLPLGSGITGSVVERGEAELVNDANLDPRVVIVPGTPTDEQESIIVAPLHSPAGVIGALNLYRIGRDFEPEDLELAKLYANHAAIALENAQIHAQLLTAARTDPLTGLLHHGSFQDALTRTIEAGPAAVLMIDLDDFRSYNNQFGHQAGDRLLRRIAELLVGSVRAGDIVCRYGGDEFAMVLPGTDQAGAQRVGDKVLAAFAELRTSGHDIHVGASIGTAAYPHDAGDARDLVSIADTALFVAKHFGKGRAVAAADLPTHVREMRGTLEEVVRAAVASRATDPEQPLDVVALVRPLHELLRTQAPLMADANARVSAMCRRIGPHFDLHGPALAALEAAALITDIGRLVAGDGPATAGGSIAFAHPVIAALLLEPYRELDAVTEVVRHHHERWDGSGYPDGIRGETMTPSLRLYITVERYCGLVTPWDKSEPLAPAAALEQLRREAGTLLPPDAVEAVTTELAEGLAA